MNGNQEVQGSRTEYTESSEVRKGDEGAPLPYYRANQEVQSRLPQRSMANPLWKDDGLAPRRESAGRHDGRDQITRYGGDAGDSYREGVVIGGATLINC